MGSCQAATHSAYVERITKRSGEFSAARSGENTSAVYSRRSLQRTCETFSIVKTRGKAGVHANKATVNMLSWNAGSNLHPRLCLTVILPGMV
jgi:hypothetical protein